MVIYTVIVEPKDPDNTIDYVRAEFIHPDAAFGNWAEATDTHAENPSGITARLYRKRFCEPNELINEWKNFADPQDTEDSE